MLTKPVSDINCGVPQTIEYTAKGSVVLVLCVFSLVLGQKISYCPAVVVSEQTPSSVRIQSSLRIIISMSTRRKIATASMNRLIEW